MRREEINCNSIPDAANRIFLDYFKQHASDESYFEVGQNYYFDGWDGLGASAVLAAIAKIARRSQLEEPSRFDIVIHVDCSVWESRRTLQRRIAEELKLDRSAMELLFDEQDEMDDFSGVDKSDRAEIAHVAKLVYNMTKGPRLLVIFHNGSDDEIDLARFGLPIFDAGNKLLWTFRGRFRLDPAVGEKVKSAHCYLWGRLRRRRLPRVIIRPDPVDRERVKLDLVLEEASQLCPDISPTLMADCWFYWCRLYFDHDNLIDYDEYAHASNCWVCDGIIPAGDSAWKIGETLQQALRLDFIPTKKNRELFPMFRSDVLQKKTSAWISVTSKDVVKNKNIKVVSKETTSYFLTLERSDHPTALPKHLFHQSTKLRVLRLSCCTFSFTSPPFICCHNLRFLWVDGCRNEDAEFVGGTHEEQVNDWEFLKNLWVLDIRDTTRDWILSPSKMRMMGELRELNLKEAGASSCVWDMDKLELTWLCNIQRLRVIDSYTFFTALEQDSFMGMPKLELLDLSGNSEMEVLPKTSAASRLRVLIVDGCAGLQQVEPVTLPKSLESFSFDGFGRASRWKNSLHMLEKKARPNIHANQEPPKVYKISLEGCEELKNIFLRGLPNIKELNISDTAIKTLDLETIQVLQIESLFLLGCWNLHRLKWGHGGHPRVTLLCIDFRAKEERGPADDCCQYYLCPQIQQETSRQMVHIVIIDAKFLQAFESGVFPDISGITESNQHFHIHFASSGGRRKVIGNNEERVTISSTAGYPYMDVLTKVIKMVDNGEACTQHLPLGRHIEISKGGCNWKSKDQMKRMEHLMAKGESFHMHDHPSVTTGNLETQIYWGQFPNIRWCCIERCPKLHTVFLLDQSPVDKHSFEKLEAICVSRLLAVQCVWSRKLMFRFLGPFRSFQKLHRIHLHSCPRLKFILPWSFHTLASLETIHITYCGEVRHIFPKWEDHKDELASTSIEFPRLKHVHLHELPMLQHICEIDMLAPALETIFLRGCWSLMRLPAIISGHGLDNPLAVVDCEKEWWDNLKWDGLEASRPLFMPRCSRYYKKVLPRVSVLR